MNDSQPPSSSPATSVCQAGQFDAHVVAQRTLADETFGLTIRCPSLAERISPGQFFMVRPPGGTDPLLGRPFALYDVYWEHDDTCFTPMDVEFVYHTVGKLTALMPYWKVGHKLEVWGPLGNGFPVVNVQHLLCVGGGIGYTPFLAVARQALGQGIYGGQPSRQRCQKVTFCYGVQSRRLLADLQDFESIPGLDIQISTDDGTAGHHGLVTDLVSRALVAPQDHRPGAVFCCGPELMMHAVARICQQHQVPCWLSLETPMACGFGACFSCVTRVRIDDGSWDYRRTCVEGPIFSAEALVFSANDSPAPLNDKHLEIR